MKISIITINFNNKNGLRKTIESVICQTYHNYEFIIIDGASTDGSLNIIKDYEDKIDIWISEPDRGIYHAMNKGILKATGDYLNFLNSGDCFYKRDVLEIIANSDNRSDMIVGKDFHYNKITNQGFVIKLPPRLSMLTFINDTLPHQSTFFKRELFNTSLYDDTLDIAADMKFYIQKICIEQCSVSFIDEIICLREPDGVSMIQNKKRELEYNKIIKDILPIGAIKDYQSLHHLDKSTMYKLMIILDNATCRKWLTYCIKFIYRINKRKITT